MSDYTILIIDYDPRMIESARTVLEGAGYRVETAGDGISGMKAFEQIKPALTLIELMLPKKSGLEVCRELRDTEHGEDAALVITGSRFRSRQYRNDARHTYKADDFVEKPISAETLLALVDALVTGRQLADANSAPVDAQEVTEVPAEVPVEVGVGAPGGEAVPASPAAAAQAKSAPSKPAKAGGEDSLESEIGDHLDSLLGF